MCAVADNLNSVIAGNLTLLHTQTVTPVVSSPNNNCVGIRSSDMRAT